MRKFILAFVLLFVAASFTAMRSSSALSTPAITSITPSCSGLRVSLMYYNQPRAVRLNNQVTVNVDGIVYTEKFGANYFRTFYWDPSIDHIYTVTIDGNQLMGDKLVNDSVTSDSYPAC